MTNLTFPSHMWLIITDKFAQIEQGFHKETHQVSQFSGYVWVMYIPRKLLDLLFTLENIPI